MSKENKPASLIELTHFAFPDLEDDHANFRLQVDLRYRKNDGDFATRSVIMPGLSSYWECSKEENDNKKKRSDENRAQKDRYKRICVRKRARDDGQNGIYENQIDTKEVDLWDRSFRVNSTTLYELRVSVFDVDRDDWFDGVVDVLKGAIGVLTAVPLLGGALEPLIEGAASSVGSELAKSDDKVLFVGSSRRNKSGSLYELGGDSEYVIRFQVKTIEDDAVPTNQENMVS